MTAYVDNARIPARAGGIRARWSHLTADTPAELGQFAARIGLRPAWLQSRCKYGSCPTVDGMCCHFHFDVTDAKRQEAIDAGAKAIDVREMGALTSALRAAYLQETPG